MNVVDDSIVTGNEAYDPVLYNRIEVDIVRYRCRRSVFALLSLLIILGQLSVGVGIVVANVAHSDAEDYGSEIVVLSSISAFLITMDISLGIRERAAANHAVMQNLFGMRNQMKFPRSSALWQEYGNIKAFARVNYIEAVFDLCSRPFSTT